jgi:ATP synthase protein I
MAPSNKKPPAEPETGSKMGDLSARLDELSHRIDAEKQERTTSLKQPARFEGVTGYAKGYRLASEFVAGTLVGGLVGYGVDWLFGTLPLGLIVFLLLGFGAGILNMARAANRVAPAQDRLGNNVPPPAVPDDEEED